MRRALRKASNGAECRPSLHGSPAARLRQSASVRCCSIPARRVGSRPPRCCSISRDGRRTSRKRSSRPSPPDASRSATVSPIRRLPIRATDPACPWRRSGPSEKPPLAGFRPDLTLILDVDPALGLERAGKRSTAKDRYESEPLDFHRRVRDGFLEIAAAEPGRCSVIDSARDEDLVAEEILAAALRRLHEPVG